MEVQKVPEAQRVLIASLAALLRRGGRSVRLFETHISWVLVTKHLSYKFKKALRYDFLDFSTLQARHHYCLEELRLNRRFAPDLYLGSVCVTGTPAFPSMDGPGRPIEYGVKMRTFQQRALWTHRVEEEIITAVEIDALARLIARFHGDAAIASSHSMWGAPDAIRQSVDGNLDEITALVHDVDGAKAAQELKAWQVAQCEQLACTFRGRKAQGFIRECHGDLHVGNILTMRGVVSTFDCIEFNESLRWIDVMDDVSFICMDLTFRRRRDLAARLLSQYLQITGDYEGLSLLRFYRTQRALVRCKVTLLNEIQSSRDGRGASGAACVSQQYLRFALESARKPQAALIIMHGFSGSGKSTLAKYLVEAFGAVQIRSDIERKRMLGMSPLTNAGATPLSGVYDPVTTELTYRSLHRLARHVVDAGWPVIVDATFLKRAQRVLFEDLARHLGVPFVILDVRTDEYVMRKRIISRSKFGQDPSDAGLDTLAHQLATVDALCEDERQYVVEVSGEWGPNTASLQSALGPVRVALECCQPLAGPIDMPPDRS